MDYFILINYQINEAEANNTLALVRQMGSDGELMKFDVANAEEIKQALDQWSEQHKR
jgi:hypothetical protein